MTDPENVGHLLRSAERPRKLTSGESTRLHDRIAAAETPAVDPHLTAITSRQPAERVRRQRSHLSSLMLAGGSVAAVAILLITLTIRQAPEPEPALPLADTPNASVLPRPPSENERFCTEHVDAVTNALERWRGVENWAWARGTPDLSTLVGEALQFASTLDDPELTSQATRALDRLTTSLADIDPSLSDRDAVPPTVAAVDQALDSIIAIARSVEIPCETEPLMTARAVE